MSRSRYHPYPRNNRYNNHNDNNNNNYRNPFNNQHNNYRHNPYFPREFTDYISKKLEQESEQQRKQEATEHATLTATMIAKALSLSQTSNDKLNNTMTTTYNNCNNNCRGNNNNIADDDKNTHGKTTNDNDPLKTLLIQQQALIQSLIIKNSLLLPSNPPTDQHSAFQPGPFQDQRPSPASPATYQEDDSLAFLSHSLSNQPDSSSHKPVITSYLRKSQQSLQEILRKPPTTNPNYSLDTIIAFTSDVPKGYKATFNKRYKECLELTITLDAQQITELLSINYLTFENQPLTATSAANLLAYHLTHTQNL